MSSQSNKNTSVFLDGGLSHAEAQRGGAGGSTSVSTTIDRSTWKRVRLGDVCEISKGEQLNRTTLAEKGRIPVYNGGSAPSGYAEEANTDAENVIISEGGNSCGYVNYIHVPFWRGGHCYLLDTKLDKLLLYYVLKANESKIMSLRVGTGLPNIQRKRLNAFEFDLPIDTIKQRQIVSAFVSIDTHISALQSLIAKYEAIKKATVNLLLEPKDEWRIVPLGEICEVCSTRRVHESDWTDLGVPFYRARELVALNEGRSITPLHISENLYKELIASSGAIRPGDLLVTGVGSIGVPYLVKRDDKFYFKDGNIIWFKNRGEILPDYFLHAFRSDHIQKQIIEMACVGTVGSYTITNGKRTLIALPPLDEQKRIVAILDSIDGTISGLKSQLAKAQDIKQGMMSYFFG